MALGTPSTLLHNLLWVGVQGDAEALKSLSPHPQCLAHGRYLRCQWGLLHPLPSDTVPALPLLPKSASATGMPTAVTSTWPCTWRLAM